MVHNGPVAIGSLNFIPGTALFVKQTTVDGRTPQHKNLGTNQVESVETLLMEKCPRYIVIGMYEES